MIIIFIILYEMKFISSIMEILKKCLNSLYNCDNKSNIDKIIVKSFVIAQFNLLFSFNLLLSFILVLFLTSW